MMKIEITRNVVNDLWSLDRTGQASAESRVVVKEYLAADPDFRAVLETSEQLTAVTPPVRLSPDAERHLLDVTLARVRSRALVLGVAIAGGTLLLLALIGAVLFLLNPRG